MVPKSLTTAGALALLLVPALTPLPAAAAESEPLWTFRPGSPDEPAWTVLKLDVAREDATPTIAITMENGRCPYSWMFLFLERTPETYRTVVGGGFRYSGGEQGAEVHTTGEFPTRLEFENMDKDGERECGGLSRVNFHFPKLPVGDVYLLHYFSGLQFNRTATFLAPHGGVTVLDSRSGDRTWFIAGSGFSPGEHNIGFYSPGFYTTPSTTPQDGLWNPSGGYISSGSVAGAESSKDRTTMLEFEHRPYFKFVGGGKVKISNATVTDPVGRIMTNQHAKATADGRDVGAVTISSSHATWPLASGPYRFDIHESTTVAAVGSWRWSVDAADFAFPDDP